MSSGGKLYNKFLTLMQTDQPIIHPESFLQDGLTELTRGLMVRFVKATKLDEKSGLAISEIDLTKSESNLCMKQVDVHAETKEVLISILYDAYKVFVYIVTYILLGWCWH